MSSVGAAYMYAHEQKARSARSSTSSIESPRVSAEQPRQSSHSGSSLKHAAQKIIQAAKEHHRSANSAFDAYYGTNYYSRNTGATGSARNSA